MEEEDTVVFPDFDGFEEWLDGLDPEDPPLPIEQEM